MNNEKEKEKENIQHTINATEGERQLSSVGNNFKETDEVAKDVFLYFLTSNVIGDDVFEPEVIIGKSDIDIWNHYKNFYKNVSYKIDINIIFDNERLLIEREYYRQIVRGGTGTHFVLGRIEISELINYSAMSMLDISRFLYKKTFTELI